MSDRPGRARQNRTLALLVVALGTFVCACSHDASERATRHITYWEKWTGFESEAMDAVVLEFNAKEIARSKVDRGYSPIEVEKITISNVEQKLLIAIAGGNPPDLAGTYSFNVAAYADHGALDELDPMLARVGFAREAYIDHYLKLGEYRGKTWALPIAPASIALLLNKRLLREVGLDPERAPLTIEELDEYAEKLTKWEVTLPNGVKELRSGYLPEVPLTQKRLVQAGFLPGDLWAYGWGHFFGGELLNDSEKISAADPENIRGYTWFASYSQHLGVAAIKRFRSGFGNFASPQNPFLSGKVAMVLQGVWMHNFIDRYAPGLEWAAAPFPYPADRPELVATTSADADVLVIPKGSAHPAEAFAFMTYLSTQPVLEELCLAQQKFTPLKVVSDEFWHKHPNPYIRLFRDLGMSKNAFSAPQTGIWNEYNRELANAADLIQNLTETPSVALSAVQTKMQHALDRHSRILARRSAK